MAFTVEPSELELQILALLWARGPLTARQVLESLPDGKPRAYTSVLSVMQVMEKKGLLGHESEGNAHVYRPKVAKGRVLRTTLTRLVKQVFGGRSSAAIQTLLEETPVSAEELAEIRRTLDAMGSEKKNGARTKA